MACINLDMLLMPDLQWVECTQARGEECLQRGNKESPIHGNNWYNDSISGNRQYRFSTFLAHFSMVVVLLGNRQYIFSTFLTHCPLWQILIIQFLGKFFKTVRLDWRLWLVSVAIGLVRYALQSFDCVTCYILNARGYYPDWSLCIWTLISMMWNPFFHRTHTSSF